MVRVVAVPAALPGYVAGIAFGFAGFAADGIVNADYSDAISVVWALHETLLAMPIDSLEVEVACTGGYWLVAVKTPPFGWGSIDADESAFISANLNFGYTVHDDFERAFAIAGTA
jgi:hypothetical protein